MTKQNIYVVQGLGLGDDEDAFENMCAFANLADAEAFVEEVKREDAEEGFEVLGRLEQRLLGVTAEDDVVDGGWCGEAGWSRHGDEDTQASCQVLSSA